MGFAARCTAEKKNCLRTAVVINHLTTAAGGRNLKGVQYYQQGGFGVWCSGLLEVLQEVDHYDDDHGIVICHDNNFIITEYYHSTILPQFLRLQTILPGVYIPLTVASTGTVDFSYGNTRGLSGKIISRCGENTPHCGVKYPAMRGKYPALRGKFPAWGVIDTPRVAAG